MSKIAEQLSLTDIPAPPEFAPLPEQEISGEVLIENRPVLPTHYKCPQSGAALPVENPEVWVYQDDLNDTQEPA